MRNKAINLFNYVFRSRRAPAMIEGNRCPYCHKLVEDQDACKCKACGKFFLRPNVAVLRYPRTTR